MGYEMGMGEVEVAWVLYEWGMGRDWWCTDGAWEGMGMGAVMGIPAQLSQGPPHPLPLPGHTPTATPTAMCCLGVLQGLGGTPTHCHALPEHPLHATRA